MSKRSTNYNNKERPVKLRFESPNKSFIEISFIYLTKGYENKDQPLPNSLMERFHFQVPIHNKSQSFQMTHGVHHTILKKMKQQNETVA